MPRSLTLPVAQMDVTNTLFLLGVAGAAALLSYFLLNGAKKPLTCE